MKKTALAIIGTRPEAIKMIPVVARLRKTGNFRVKVCVTAQHRQMLDQVLDVFAITPDFDLDIMKTNQNLPQLSADILTKVDAVISKIKPDIVLVQGDTTTAFIASLAAFYARVMVGHIEAGLRTARKYSPFPEEMNRRLITAVADLHFAPTDTARANLRKEGIPEKSIFVTGNTSIDTLLVSVKKVRSRVLAPAIRDCVRAKGRKLILVTAHRRESFGAGFQNICLALKDIAMRNADVDIVYPVHPNPHVRRTVGALLAKTERIHLIEPLDYVSFVALMNAAYVILTDSGGVQEEAPSLQKPVLVLRECTERIEAVQSGAAKLVGVDRKAIVRQAEKLLHDVKAYERMKCRRNPYGDGRAADRIVSALNRILVK